MRVLSAHPWLAGGFLVVAALVAAAIVWWLIPNEPLSAQEVMADACIDAAITLDYDVTVRIMAPEDTGEVDHGGSQRERTARAFLYQRLQFQGHPLRRRDARTRELHDMGHGLQFQLRRQHPV